MMTTKTKKTKKKVAPMTVEMTMKTQSQMEVTATPQCVPVLPVCE